MKKWKCNVCGYIHEGNTPPDKCPVCGVGPEEFTVLTDEAIQNTAQQEKKSVKRWKCTVCDYIHVGDEPPESCPLCAAGKEAFALLDDTITLLTPEAINTSDDNTARSALDKISYGLYVVTTAWDGVLNGQCCNTVFQITSSPLKIGIGLNNRNYTTELVKQSGVVAISILGLSHMEFVQHFGYQTGRKVDKFANLDYLLGKNGCPILPKSISFLEARIIPDESTNVGTHTLFVAEVTSGRMTENSDPLTYAYYRNHK